MTGTRPRACATHHSTTSLCSLWDSVGLSPVVPTGTRPLVPSAICQSTRARKAFSSTDPFLNGVTSAVNEPRNLVLAVMIRPSAGKRARAAPLLPGILSGKSPRCIDNGLEQGWKVFYEQLGARREDRQSLIRRREQIIFDKKYIVSLRPRLSS